MKLEDVKTSPLCTGRNELIKRMENKHLTTKQAILGKCYECMNGYIDGKEDCEMDNCALYEYMPFGKIQYKSESRVRMGKKNANIAKFFKQDT